MLAPSCFKEKMDPLDGGGAGLRANIDGKVYIMYGYKIDDYDDYTRFYSTENGYSFELGVSLINRIEQQISHPFTISLEDNFPIVPGKTYNADASLYMDAEKLSYTCFLKFIQITDNVVEAEFECENGKSKIRHGFFKFNREY